MLNVNDFTGYTIYAPSATVAATDVSNATLYGVVDSKSSCYRVHYIYGYNEATYGVVSTAASAEQFVKQNLNVSLIDSDRIFNLTGDYAISGWQYSINGSAFSGKLDYGVKDFTNNGPLSAAVAGSTYYLRPDFKYVKFTIKYESDKTSSYTVTSNAKINEMVSLSNLTGLGSGMSGYFVKNGYELDGWSTDDEKSVFYIGTSYIGSLLGVSYGTTDLFPHYAPGTYDVIYHNGDDVKSETVEYNKYFALKRNEFTSGDKAFAGWSLSDQDDVPVYSDGEIVRNINNGFYNDGSPKDINLYAKWTDGLYTIRFHSNYHDDMEDHDDDFIVERVFDASSDHTINRNINPFRRDGKVINAWNELYDTVRGEKIHNTISVLKSGSRANGEVYDFYGNWINAKYAVKLIGDGGVTETIEIPLSDKNKTPSLPESMKKVGSRLKCWKDENGNEYARDSYFSAVTYNNEIYSYDALTPSMLDDKADEEPDTVDSATANVLDSTGYSSTNLTLVYENAVYTVRFDPNGGDGDMMSDQEIKRDTKVSLSKVTYTREGYVFAGWAVEKNTPPIYADKEEVLNIAPEDGGIILYAVWEPGDWTGKKIVDFREYKNIYVNDADSNPNGDSIGLGYVSNMGTSKFKCDVYTYFHYPLNEVLNENTGLVNISSTTLVGDGARYGSAPYKSDRIYKLRYDYENTSPYGKSNPVYKNNGTWLCTWLSGDVLNSDIEPVWMDRWFVSGKEVPDSAAMRVSVIKLPKNEEVQNLTILDVGRIVNDVIDHLYMIGGYDIDRIVDLEDEDAISSKLDEITTVTKLDSNGDDVKRRAFSLGNSFNGIIGGRVYDVPSEMTFDYGAYYKYYHMGDSTISDICSAINNTENVVINVDDWSDETKSEYVTFVNSNDSSFKYFNDKDYYDTSEHGVSFNGIDQVILYGDGERLGHPVSGNITVVSWIRNDDWKNTTSNSIIDSYYDGGWKIGVVNRAFTPFTFYGGNSVNLQQNGTMCAINMNGDLASSRKFWKTEEMHITDMVGDHEMYVYILDTYNGNRIHKIDRDGNRLITTKDFGIGENMEFIDVGRIGLGADLYVYGRTNGSWNVYRVDRWNMEIEKVSDSMVRDIGGAVVIENVNIFVYDKRNTFICDNGVDTNDGEVVMFDEDIGTLKVHRIDDSDAISTVCDYDNVVWVLKKNVVEKYSVLHHEYTKVDYFDLKPGINPTMIDMVSYCKNGKVRDYIYVVCEESQMVYVYSVDGVLENEINLSSYFVIPRNRRHVSTYDWYRMNKDYTNCLYVGLMDSSYMKILKVGLDEISDKEWHQISFTSGDYEVKLYVDCKLKDTIMLDSHASYRYDTSIVFGGMSGKTRSLYQESNLTNTCFAGYIDGFALYASTLSHEDLYYLYMNKFRMDDLTWNYTENAKFYIEKVDRKYKFKMPGSKSNCYVITIKGGNVYNDEVKGTIENSIRKSLSKIVPVYTKLFKIEWV